MVITELLTTKTLQRTFNTLILVAVMINIESKIIMNIKN